MRDHPRSPKALALTGSSKLALLLASIFLGMRSKKTTGTSPCEQWRGGVLVLAIVSSCVGVAFTQQPFGIIVGTVTDQMGATLSAATITVTNTETQAGQTVATSATGDYSAPYLVNGIYTDKGGTPGLPGSGDKPRGGSRGANGTSRHSYGIGRGQTN